MKVRYYIQKIFGRLLYDPIIPPGKTTGFSLVRSEKADSIIERNTKVIAPFYLHNVRLCEYSYIARNCNITNTHIGRFCSIGPNFCCGLGIHPTNGISTSPMFYSTSKQNGVSLCKENKIKESLCIEIGHDVFIGANVTVLDGVKISDGAVIGAGAVVVDDIPPYAIAAGVPAKVVKYRFSQDQIEALLQRRWWNDPNKELPKVERYFDDINTFLKY